jgi:hypothetical protein
VPDTAFPVAEGLRRLLVIAAVLPVLLTTSVTVAATLI